MSRRPLQPSTPSPRSSIPKHEQKSYRYLLSYTLLTRQLEEAVKTYQKALQLHQEQRWAETERAYLNILTTEIILERASKRVPPPTLLRRY